MQKASCIQKKLFTVLHMVRHIRTVSVQYRHVFEVLNPVSIRRTRVITEVSAYKINDATAIYRTHTHMAHAQMM